jgi:hypothetical protein
MKIVKVGTTNKSKFGYCLNLGKKKGYLIVWDNVVFHSGSPYTGSVVNKPYDYKVIIRRLFTLHWAEWARL